MSIWRDIAVGPLTDLLAAVMSGVLLITRSPTLAKLPKLWDRIEGIVEAARDESHLSKYLRIKPFIRKKLMKQIHYNFAKEQ